MSFYFVAGINSADDSGSIALVKSRLIIDRFCTFITSAGWTLVESRLVQNDYEWSVFKKPSSLGVSSHEWHFAMGATSGATWSPLYNAIFMDWNSSSKMTTKYPSTTSLSITGSGTTTNSITRLPGSGNSFIRTQAWPQGTGLWGVADFRSTSIELYFYHNNADVAVSVRQILVNRKETFVLGEFEPLAPQADDGLTAFLLHGFTEITSAAATHTNLNQRGYVITDPVKFGTGHTSAMEVCMTESFFNVDSGTVMRPPIQSWNAFGPDAYTGKQVLSKIAIRRGPRAYSTSSRYISERGITRNFYLMESNGAALQEEVNWTFNATSYSGKGYFTFLNGLLIIQD